MAKHFGLEITDASFSYRRKKEKIAEGARLDGLYLIRTGVPEHMLSAAESVGAYKSLSTVERAFRTIKTVDLKVRPIHHRLEDRVRCHIFVYMLAYYVEWHMRRAATWRRSSSTTTIAKRERRCVSRSSRPRSAHPQLVQRPRPREVDPSFRTLLADLGSIVRNTCKPTAINAPSF